MAGHAAFDAGGFRALGDNGSDGARRDAALDASAFAKRPEQASALKPGGFKPRFDARHGSRAKVEDGAASFRVRLRDPDCDAAGTVAFPGDVVDVEGGNFRNPQGGVGSDGNHGGVTEAGKGLPAVAGLGGNGVGLLPSDSGYLPGRAGFGGNGLARKPGKDALHIPIDGLGQTRRLVRVSDCGGGGAKGGHTLPFVGHAGKVFRDGFGRRG